MSGLYDPLTYDNLMAGLVVHFERRPRVRLSDVTDIHGPGIYSLFYAGAHDAYGPISGRSIPIYVGKAVPPGARTGAAVDVAAPALQRRISEHARSLNEVHSLEAADFKCRYMPVVPVWITLAERFLIDHYKPIWNLQLDGFGNHDPGAGRRQGEASWWDTLHPGRAWADKLRQVKTAAEASRRVNRFFKEKRPARRPGGGMRVVRRTSSAPRSR